MSFWQDFFPKTGVVLTGAITAVSWITAVDIGLRIALSIAGLFVARATYAYYKRAREKLDGK